VLQGEKEARGIIEKEKYIPNKSNKNKRLIRAITRIPIDLVLRLCQAKCFFTTSTSFEFKIGARVTVGRSQGF
jgi:hypothetical protein